MRWSKTKFHWSLQTVLSYRKKLKYLCLLSRNLGVAPQDHVNKRINSVHLWINFLWDITLLWICTSVFCSALSPSKAFPCDYTQICTFSQSFVHCFTVFRWVEIFCWWDHKSWGMGKELHSSVPGFLFCSKMRVPEKAWQMLPVCFHLLPRYALAPHLSGKTFSSIHLVRNPGLSFHRWCVGKQFYIC